MLHSLIMSIFNIIKLTEPFVLFYLLVEEMIGQVVEDHGIGGVNGVGFGQ